MYHFAGYLVRNDARDVVHYSPTRAQAMHFCQQSGVAPSGITQIYDWQALEYTEPAAVDDTLTPSE